MVLTIQFFRQPCFSLYLRCRVASLRRSLNTGCVGDRGEGKHLKPESQTRMALTLLQRQLHSSPHPLLSPASIPYTARSFATFQIISADSRSPVHRLVYPTVHPVASCSEVGYALACVSQHKGSRDVAPSGRTQEGARVSVPHRLPIRLLPGYQCLPLGGGAALFERYISSWQLRVKTSYRIKGVTPRCLGFPFILARARDGSVKLTLERRKGAESRTERQDGSLD